MSFSFIFVVIAVVIGSISFFIGFKSGPKRYGFQSYLFVKNYALIPPLADIALFNNNISHAIGLGPSKNDDCSFSKVIQYQEGTLPLIMNMISRVKSNDQKRV